MKFGADGQDADEGYWLKVLLPGGEELELPFSPGPGGIGISKDGTNYGTLVLDTDNSYLFTADSGFTGELGFSIGGKDYEGDRGADRGGKRGACLYPH